MIMGKDLDRVQTSVSHLLHQKMRPKTLLTCQLTADAYQLPYRITRPVSVCYSAGTALHRTVVFVQRIPTQHQSGLHTAELSTVI